MKFYHDREEKKHMDVTGIEPGTSSRHSVHYLMACDAKGGLGLFGSSD